MHRAAGVDEGQAVALQALHDEALAAEQAHADAALKRDADRHALGGAEKRVLLADQFPPERLQIHRQNLARIRSGEGDLMLALTTVGEHGHEEALAGQQALAGPDELVEDAAVLLVAAVTEHGFHLDGAGHEHHGPRLGHGTLARVQFHLDKLHVVAVNAVVHVV